MLKKASMFLLITSLVISMTACGTNTPKDEQGTVAESNDKVTVQPVPELETVYPDNRSTEATTETGEKIYNIGDTITVTNGDAIVEVTLESIHFSDTYSELPDLPNRENTLRTADTGFTFLIYDISVNYLGDFDQPVTFSVSEGELKYKDLYILNSCYRQNYVGINAQPYALNFHYGPTLNTNPEFAFEMFTSDVGTVSCPFIVGELVETDTTSSLLLTVNLQLVVYGEHSYENSILSEPYSFRLR